MKKNIWIAGSAAVVAISAGVVWYLLHKKSTKQDDEQMKHGKENPHPGVEHLHRINKKVKQAL